MSKWPSPDNRNGNNLNLPTGITDEKKTHYFFMIVNYKNVISKGLKVLFFKRH